MSKVLGKDHIKKEMELKITGKATYVGDIDLPDNKASLFGMTDISFARGDIEQGFKDADVILQSRYQWPTTAHAPLLFMTKKNFR